MNASTAAIEVAIQELEAEIDATSLELQAKIRSLEVLKGILRKMNSGTVVKTSNDKEKHESKTLNEEPDLIDLQELAGGIGQKKRTLADDVVDLLPKVGAQEFNIAHVEALLKRAGIEVNAKSPRSRISVALAKLCDDGILMRTFAVGGNVPNRYRTKATMTDAEVMSALANNAGTGSETSPSQSEKQ
jgi:hypothetical protein